MTGDLLPDQEHRDVISGVAEGALAGTLFVDAGAGTGKTTALVGRVVSLLRTGVPVGEIAAITFTEAAAGELRHRVREAVEEALAVTDADQERQRFRMALAGIDDASFTTLHAFAHRILLDHPLEAALPPELALFDDIEEAARFEQEWDTWLAEFVTRDEVQPVLEHLDQLNVGIPRIHRLARALHDDYHRIPPGLATEPDSYRPPPLELDEVFAELDALAALADEAVELAPDDKLVTSLREWVEAAQPLRQAATADAPLDAQLAALSDLEEIRLAPGGSPKAWGGQPQLSAVKARRKALRDEVIPRALRGQYDHVLRAMTRWVACFVLQWAEQRRRTGQLVFQDLLVTARDVLRDHPEVRRRVRARYRHLLIDEFQDTDPIQIEIAVLLAAEDHGALASAARPDGSVPWEDATLVPGRLFFVGDPKQSIYRFRGADIAVYEGAKAFVQGDGAGAGEVRELTHNFRSVPGVLAWVNAAFAELLRERERAQPAYLELSGNRAEVEDLKGPAVRWFGGMGGSAQQVREAEARDVVDVVRSLVGRTPVLDPRTGEVRPARAADVAVLVRRHATARQLERCFDDAGLALVVEARSLVFGSDEVRDLTTILTAVEDPNDQVAVLGALRHPAFGCSDADLVDWSGRGRSWWLPRPDDEPVDHPVGAALHWLALLRAQRAERTVGGFVEHVIAETQLAELALVHRRYRDRWRRIRFVADQARAFDEAGGHLRGFVRWLREQAEQGVRRDEHVVPDTDDDAVHVTTVHAAKGLEYPIVVVLGLDTATDRPLHDPTLLWGDAGGVEVNLGRDAKTAGYEPRCAGEREFHHEEEQRLLYVATTRARDLLVISRHHGEHNQTRCHAAALTGIEELLAPHWAELELPTLEGRSHDPTPTGEGRSDDPTSALSPPPMAPRPPTPTATTPSTTGRVRGDGLHELAEFERRHRESVAAALRPRVVAATTIADLLAVAPAAPREASLAASEEDEETDPQPWRKGRSGTAVGRAVHAVLQSIDLATLGGLDAAARVQCAAEGLDPGAVASVVAMVRRAAESPTVAKAVASGRFWRELHVGVPIDLGGDGEITVEGFVDLLVEDGDGYVVVDYKTDATRGRTPEEIATRYRPQAATYATALEAVLGRPVQRCVFVLTGAASGDDREVEIAGGALAEARTELLGALRRLVRQE